MADWASTMQQTFEFYTVDPISWKDTSRMDNIKTCTINRDSQAETLGSASFDITGSVGECYIRVYLVTVQNGITEKHPLGTFLVQTPTSKFDGRIRNVTMDAYTPLLELKEKQPPIGYYIAKDEDVMTFAHILTRDNVRAPVSAPVTPSTKLANNFVADSSDTYLSFISDLLTVAYDNTKYKFDLDEMGRILFAPEQDTASLSPVWTYADDNSSILYSELSMDHDLYGIPNVVEVIYSDGKVYYESRAVNDDPNSPISTVGRGREILHRVTNPEIYGSPTQERVDEHAKKLLKELSSIEYTITYTHGYCPVRIGDCVRLNYSRAGLTNVKAKVISQSIKCEPGCPVTEKAIFTTKLWG
jgi:hypothetical protein